MIFGLRVEVRQTATTSAREPDNARAVRALEILSISSGHLTVLHGRAHFTLSSRVRKIGGAPEVQQLRQAARLAKLNPVRGRKARDLWRCLVISRQAVNHDPTIDWECGY